MSSKADSPEAPESPPGPAQRQRPKPPRMLACVLCSQRKVKCDRQLPCSNCVKFRAQCVPATLAPRQRRHRIAERELLDRLRKYEELLRQNRITFEPLHKESARPCTNEANNGYDSDGADELTVESQYEAKNILQSMSQSLGDGVNDSDSSQDDAVRAMAIKEAWEQSSEDADHLLFGSRGATVDVSALHPDAVQIFRLWQVYLDNVNPLLKVTHTPSMQGRIIEAASHIRAIDPILEALMFSIYCTAILSLSEEECQTMAGSPKNQLLTRYQYGCQQALLNCGFLRTSDRECLTALFLYLISVQPSTVPQSLHAMMGVAVHIAQRMGIHSESALVDCTVFEAEMRRRLWWALTLFDSRIAQLASSKTVTLDPTWDCNIPLNVNDSDLRPEMKEPPAIQGSATEAIFAVVRSEIADFVRYSAFHLDFTSPALKTIAKQPARVGTTAKAADLAKLEEVIQDRYLKSCDPDNPLHFMTMWTT
ncbi:C6 transcription factor [Cladophialophora carrionii]|uniref:C6 transcription factor n=1 Tax=Cladophialophora carrionii TaxID=86049 RepID=A0A1C1CDT1_9EURO|nr:C6 transcription factor [Cladophialophora carrionii]